VECGELADVSESLQCDAGSFNGTLSSTKNARGHLGDSSTDSFLTTWRAEQRQRFTRATSWRKAVDPAVFIHQPSHGLCIGSNVWSGNIRLWAKYRREQAGPGPDDVFFLSRRKPSRIHRYATFCSSEGHVHERGLPGHQARQGTNFIKVDCRMESDASLLGTSRARMLDPKSIKNLELTA
jgi:hypothetical protein